MIEEISNLSNYNKYIKDLAFFLNTLTNRIYHTGLSK
jgi:hypothetical protein